MNTRLKLLATSMLALGLSYPAYSQNTVASCADIQDREERLSCYDGVAESSRDLPVVRLPRAPRPESQEESGNDVSRSGDDFGLEQEEAARPARQARVSGPDVRTYVVSAARHNDFTGWTIEFEDGGTWKQVGTDDFDIEVGERYTVRRATFNSYLLSGEKSNRKIRVTRVE